MAVIREFMVSNEADGAIGPASSTDGSAVLFSGTTGTTLKESANIKDSGGTVTLTGNVVLPASTTIGPVSSTELGTLDGVTSSIQTQLNGKQGIVTNVSDTEIGYLDGVTSSIQTQLNSKQGLVANVSDTEIGYLDGVTSSIQTQINGKQGIVANVSDTEIGYLDGVTSGIQEQLNGKQGLVANVSDTEIGYLDGVTSAIQTQLNSKQGTLTNSAVLAAALGDETGTGAAVFANAPALVAPTVTNVTVGGGATLLKILTATATLDFPSTVNTTPQDLTVTVTGAAVGDSVALGVPNGSVPATSVFFAWVSAADTVTVRHSCAGVSEDPASGTFRVVVWQF